MNDEGQQPNKYCGLYARKLIWLVPLGQNWPLKQHYKEPKLWQYVAARLLEFLGFITIQIISSINIDKVFSALVYQLSFVIIKPTDGNTTNLKARQLT